MRSFKLKGHTHDYAYACRSEDISPANLKKLICFLSFSVMVRKDCPTTILLTSLVYTTLQNLDKIERPLKHSLSVVLKGQLYLPTIRYLGEQFPECKLWHSLVCRHLVDGM